MVIHDALVDSHCHLDLPAFAADREDVIARARLAGVGGFIVPAIRAATWPDVLAVAARFPAAHAALGLHPLFMPAHAGADLARLEQAVSEHPVVAIGECGLDFHAGRADAAAQVELLRVQLDLARSLDLPVILHARRSVEEVIRCLREAGNTRGVVHSFSGSEEQARQLWKLGFHLGIGGVITWPRARKLQRIVAAMPLAQLLLETDSPDQPLHGYRGTRNEPARLPEILLRVAALRGEDPRVVAAATTRNAVDLFRLPEPAGSPG